MPYLGNTPSTSFATVVKDTFNGGSTGYTLSKVATTNSVSVFVENVRQEPTTAYAVSGTTLTFTATTPSGTGNIYVLHMNPTTTTTHPAAQNLTAVDGTFTGNIDVDGTSNLDVVDIDGAVDMASTLAITGDTTLSRAETNGTVRLSLSNTGSNGTSEYSEIRLSSTAGTAATSIFQHRNNYGLNLGTTTNNAIYLLQNNSTHTTFETDGDINIADGNLVVASGHGVDFSATAGTSASNATGGSELLDDYEEGTWTPTILGSSSHPSITTSVAAGKYTRVGNLVFIQWNMIVTNVASQGSGTAQVGGLPYSMVGNTYQGHIGIMYNDTHSNETQKGYIPNNSSYINLVPTGRTQTNLGIGTISTGYFGGGGSYVVV